MGAILKDKNFFSNTQFVAQVSSPLQRAKDTYSIINFQEPVTTLDCLEEVTPLGIR
jgi:hypothetical protein